MPRSARIVVPDVPHHLIQRGNRNQTIFFSKEDKDYYLRELTAKIREHGVQIWAYSLMDNHVHFVAVPSREESFSCAFGETHKRYTRRINFRRSWRGHLWQGRFHSFPMDEKYLFAAVRYVENNPVRAGIVEKAQDFCHSSAKAHVHKLNDPILSKFYLEDEISNWEKYLNESNQQQENDIRKNLKVNRPLGSLAFIERLELLTGRRLISLKPGPKGPRGHVPNYRNN